MSKIKLVLVFLVTIITIVSQAQTVTISNPTLNTPYQVANGTVVTIEWDAFGNAPTSFLSSTTQPTVLQNISPSSSWTQHSNFLGPSNGKYYFDITVNSDTWVWAGMSGLLGWQYSNVIEIQAISAYSITASDTMICPTNGSVLFTAPSGTGYTYQWHNSSGAITGANSATYTATTAGAYNCIITIAGTPNVTNTIAITDYSASFSGSLAANQITMTADQTFSSYQWYERTPSGTATPITGATTNSYTANITSSATYYSFEGTNGSCTTTSNEKVIIDTIFTVPLVTLYTSPNSQGFVCEGTPVSMKANSSLGNIQWFANGQTSFSGTDSVNIWGPYQNGNYHVEVTPTDWPNVVLTSNSVTVQIENLIQPNINLTSGNFYDFFCNGDVSTMVLTDEGYSYTWYLHDTSGVYDASHIISVPNGVYTHTFDSTIFITVEGAFNGCTTSTTFNMRSFFDDQIYLNVDNYVQEYLCTDSSITISVPEWDTADYTNYQWYSLSGGTWNIIPNQTNYSMVVNHPGEYKVSVNPVACPSATISSIPKTIYSYLDREPFIYAHQNTICQGDTTTLQLAGGSDWYAKQWLESDVQITINGYVRQYVGMLTNSATDTQDVSEYSSYQLSAKHNSCPNGLKVKSNIVFITPTLHPEIIQTSNHPTQPKNIIDWDSTNHIIGCEGQAVELTLTNLAYDSISWWVDGYRGDDDYLLGTQFHVGDTASNTMDAKWITAVVTDANGCKGQSTPMLLDAMLFLPPTIASYGNSEFCEPGDSLLFHLGFNGTWISYQWYRNDTLIVGATNDSIWAKIPGMYILKTIPAMCPDFEYTSGTGPVARFLYADISENDSLIYALPQYGIYSYQWFFNGDSIDAPNTNASWIIRKDELQDGTYTVAVTNSDGCTKLSEPYVWSSTGIKDIMVNDLAKVFPNPTTGLITLESDQKINISAISLIDSKGEVVFRNSGWTSNSIDISDTPAGMYFLRVESKDGFIQHIKILKQ